MTTIAYSTAADFLLSNSGSAINGGASLVGWYVFLVVGLTAAFWRRVSMLKSENYHGEKLTKYKTMLQIIINYIRG